ncbi:MAG: cwp66-like protein/N-acetylmuramoyl-L-alanine amidase [Caloramator sp.]|jgi:N-acetylmuramoyl-L-alanine amidase|uniref:cell wall-binding repeat-containing protein n=1 Tax=Caloramator sp. TaxID=1871330 RepID=UPI001DA668C6|nr:cell wall-binding repeat-containing protein [Caloramator sp.]MBZ4663232.1 cwp66-like protein/N-acetylmuramoyl-L-alanine amidase [Caloramator sp.]
MCSTLCKGYKCTNSFNKKNSLNLYTKNELIRLNVKKVYIIGGTGAVSQVVEENIKQLGIQTERISGNSRYETSVKIANELKKLTPYTEVFLASGENYPDALSAASIAAIKGTPILLTKKAELPKVIEDFTKQTSITKTYIMGSINAIYGIVSMKMPNPIRIGGNNRFETNIKLIQNFSQQLNLNKIYLSIGQGSTGREYADALTGAVASAIDNTAILLTKSDLVNEVEMFVKYNLYNTTQLIVLGGTNAVSLVQENKINNLIKQIPNEDKWKDIKTVMGFNKYELIDIKMRLERCIILGKTTREREALTLATTIISKILDNPEYDYSNDVEEMKRLKANLTQSEKDNLLNIFIDNFIDLDLSKIYNLKTELGL